MHLSPHLHDFMQQPLTCSVRRDIEATQNWFKLSSDTLFDLHHSLEVTISILRVSHEYHHLHSL